MYVNLFGTKAHQTKQLQGAWEGARAATTVGSNGYKLSGSYPQQVNYRANGYVLLFLATIQQQKQLRVLKSIIYPTTLKEDSFTMEFWPINLEAYKLLESIKL